MPQNWPALEAFFREGGDPRWCWCQFWRMRSKDFGAAKVPELRERLRAQAASPMPPGLVALEDGSGGEDGGERAVGWVSLGPRADFERIVRSKVIPTIDDRPVWSIVCFAVSTGARGQGVAKALLDGAIDYAREQGPRPSRPTPSSSIPARRSSPRPPSRGRCRCSSGSGSPSSLSGRRIRRRRAGGWSSAASSDRPVRRRPGAGHLSPPPPHPPLHYALA